MNQISTSTKVINASGVMLVEEKGSSQVVEYLRKNEAKVYRWDVELTGEEEEHLRRERNS